MPVSFYRLEDDADPPGLSMDVDTADLAVAVHADAERPPGWIFMLFET